MGQLSDQLTPIVSAIAKIKAPVHNEKKLQLALEDCFIAHNIAYEREKGLGGKSTDIPDFIIGRVAIEVKIEGSNMLIYKQVCRYCEHEEIDEILLVTTKFITLPALINLKPVSVLNLAKNWL